MKCAIYCRKSTDETDTQHLPPYPILTPKGVLISSLLRAWTTLRRPRGSGRAAGVFVLSEIWLRRNLQPRRNCDETFTFLAIARALYTGPMQVLIPC